MNYKSMNNLWPHIFSQINKITSHAEKRIFVYFKMQDKVNKLHNKKHTTFQLFQPASLWHISSLVYRK